MAVSCSVSLSARALASALSAASRAVASSAMACLLAAMAVSCSVSLSARALASAVTRSSRAFRFWPTVLVPFTAVLSFVVWSMTPFSPTTWLWAVTLLLAITSLPRIVLSEVILPFALIVSFDVMLLSAIRSFPLIVLSEEILPFAVILRPAVISFSAITSSPLTVFLETMLLSALTVPFAVIFPRLFTLPALTAPPALIFLLALTLSPALTFLVTLMDSTLSLVVFTEPSSFTVIFVVWRFPLPSSVNLVPSAAVVTPASFLSSLSILSLLFEETFWTTSIWVL